MVKSAATNVAAQRPKQAKRNMLWPLAERQLPLAFTADRWHDAPGNCHRYKAPIMMKRRPPHGLSKAELRAAGQHAVAQSSKPIVKLPTKLVRQCGRCGEFGSVMVEPGQPAPEFKCKACDRP
jgi:hypothetical protein